MEASGGSIDVLTDDNLADILIHLDAVSVLRCRAVCKSWRRVATDRSFLAAHAAARPREMIIETKYGNARSTVPLSPTDDDLDTMTAAGDADGHHHHYHRYLFDPSRKPADGNDISSELELFASLDGLLVLARRGSLPPTYVICNPVTRQWANLPSPFTTVPEPLRRGGVLGFRTCVARGFYFHALSREYRLLLHCEAGALPRNLLESYCCVVSVGSAHMPRRLAQAPPWENPYPCNVDPVSYHGTLHWLFGHPEAEGSSTDEILAFDTTSETFRLMPRPPEALEPTTKARSDLLELDGELSVATIYWSSNGTMLDIWALEDYEAEQWTLHHRLKVQRPPRSGGYWKRPIIMAMGNAPRGRSSAILVGFPQTKVVMVYSLKDSKVRKKISLGSFISLKVFTESLVPHAFFA